MIFLVLLFLACYLGVAAAGVAGLWLAWQLATGRRLHLIKGYDGKPLAHADLVAKDFAIMIGFGGAVLVLLALAIPIYGLAWSTLSAGGAALAGIGGVWRHALMIRYARRVAETQDRS